MGRAPLGRRALALATVAIVSVAGCSDDTSTVAADEGSTTTIASSPELYAGYTSDVYSDDASWLCRPDTDDICDSGLDATVVAADGTTTVEPWTAADDPPIDCFYVYPTISRDETGEQRPGRLARRGGLRRAQPGGPARARSAGCSRRSTGR